MCSMSDCNGTYQQVREFVGEESGLVFSQPREELLYEEDELEDLLDGLIGKQVPERLQGSSVPRTEWVRREALTLLGYPDVQDFRSEQETVPPFPNQLLDIFVLSTPTLGIYRYNPHEVVDEVVAMDNTGTEYTGSEMRVAVVRLDDDCVIRGVRVVEGQDLARWDSTGTKSVKWQSQIPTDVCETAGVITTGGGGAVDRVRTTEQMGADERVKRLREKARNCGGELAGQGPSGKLLFDVETIAELVEPVCGSIVKPGGGSIGIEFEDRVARCLGYQGRSTSVFPDIPHQLTEVKIVKEGKVNFSKYHPESDDVFEKRGLPRIVEGEMRYVIGLGEQVDRGYRVNGVIVGSGESLAPDVPTPTVEQTSYDLRVPGFDTIGSRATGGQVRIDTYSD